MAQPTVSISAPSGNTAIPSTASGSAQPSAGNTLAGMAYQIDGGQMNPFTNFVPGGGAWSFQLTVADCMTIGQNYQLTVYAGDTSGNFASDSVNFTRTS
jgi:hypothetical protein